MGIVLDILQVGIKTMYFHCLKRKTPSLSLVYSVKKYYTKKIISMLHRSHFAPFWVNSKSVTEFNEGHPGQNNAWKKKSFLGNLIRNCNNMLKQSNYFGDHKWKLLLICAGFRMGLSHLCKIGHLIKGSHLDLPSDAITKLNTLSGSRIILLSSPQENSLTKVLMLFCLAEILICKYEELIYSQCSCKVTKVCKTI